MLQMNSLLALREQFLAGEITKSDYMDKMMSNHNRLFDYMELMNDSTVQTIEIQHNRVIVSLKETGIKLVCIKNDKGLIPFTILNFGAYEEKLWDKAFALIGNPQAILDIGANIGYFSLYFATKFPSTKIYAFEPIPNTFDSMKENIQLNHVENIESFNLGLTDKKKKLEMFYNPEGCGSSSLKDLLGATCTRKVECAFSTVDDFILEKNITHLDFIKCDVEGAEKFVYEGAFKTIERFRPLIFSEMLRKWSAKFGYHPNEIIQFFKKLDYACYAISEATFEKITEVTEETVETNFLFKPREIAQ